MPSPGVGSRRLTLTLASLAVLLAMSAVALGAAGVAPQVFRSLGLTVPTGYSSDGSAANQAAARRDADSLLAKVSLPAGATHETSEPSGDNGYLRPMEALEVDAAHATAHGWWQTEAAPSQVIAFVKAHPPAGARQFGSGSFGNVSTGSSASTISFRLPAVAGVLGSRILLVIATPLAKGGTGVLVESQSDWVVLRPTSERVPSTVRKIELSSVEVGKPSSLITLRATRPSQVRAIVRLINSLPVAQPVVYHCPALSDPRMITITFQGAGGTRLAVLTYMDWRPWLSPSVACKSIDLTIAGKRQRPLLGGNFLRTLTKLLGRSLT